MTNTVNPLTVLYDVWDNYLKDNDQFDPLDVKPKDNAEIVWRAVTRTREMMSTDKDALDKFDDVMETGIVRGDVFIDLGEESFVNMNFFANLNKQENRKLFKLFSNYIKRFGAEKYYLFYQSLEDDNNRPGEPKYEIVTPFQLRDHYLKFGYKQPKKEGDHSNDNH